jgi:hypothetical protein
MRTNRELPRKGSKAGVRSPRRISKPSSPMDIFESDLSAAYLIGSPGYRSRLSKTGLDPLDSQFELAHMQGLITHQLLTGKFRTHNSFYLCIMLLLGILGVSPLLISLACILFDGEWWTLRVVALFAVHIVMGIAVLVNAALSLREPDSPTIADSYKDEIEHVKAMDFEQFDFALIWLSLFLLVVVSLGRTVPWFHIIREDGIVQADISVLLPIVLLGGLTQMAATNLRFER